MKKILAGALALSLLGGAAAQAQSYDGYYDGGRYQSTRDYDRGDRYDRRDDRREHRADRREYRQHQRWARGQYMPSQYRTRGYVMNDYRRYGYAPPPRGYQYVRSGDDVILAVIATGLIAAVISGAFND